MSSNKKISSQLYFEVSGQCSQPVLVLLHPLGANLRFWDECLPYWQQKYGVVAYDRSGSGSSSLPKRIHSIHAHVRELEGLRDNLKLKHIIPVGVAVGAMVAAVYTARYPERVSSLVLCNPALSIGGDGQREFEHRIALIRQGGINAILPRAVDRAFSGLPKNDRYWRYLELFRQNNPRSYELSLLSAKIDLSPLLPSIHCPTLIAVGALDNIFPPEEATIVSNYLPNATYRVIHGAAHLPPFQTPKTFATIVDRFLSSNLHL